MAKKRERVKISNAQLFLDFLRWIKDVQTLEVKGGCRGNTDWTCCSGHHNLSGRRDILRARAKKIKNTKDCSVLSTKWWKIVGFDFPVEALVLD